MTTDDDPLSNLPSHDMDAERVEQIRRVAHHILAERARRQSHPIASWVSTAYHRFVEPVTLIALGLGYVAWTVQDTVVLLHEPVRGARPLEALLPRSVTATTPDAAAQSTRSHAATVEAFLPLTLKTQGI